MKEIELIFKKHIKHYEDMKRLSSSKNAKQRYHHKLHAVSELFGEIRKELKKGAINFRNE
jgi:hypothetical protein